MKTYLFIILFVFNFSVYSQETKTSELDTIRQQGYLIMETNGTDKLNDIPLKFLFIPIGNVEKDLGKSYVKNNQSNHNDLYIPTPYIFNSNDLLELNIFRKKFTKEKEEIKLNQQIVPTIDLFNKCNNHYKFKENLGQPIRTFKVIYLDGLWVKLKVPKKSASLFLEEYNKFRLNKNEKNCYDYYFLIETKAISYDILFTDNSIEVVKE
jgi:hypothetical protein